jgi:DNA-binding transcriptional regulator YdaS (Cro superfamily)
MDSFKSPLTEHRAAKGLTLEALGAALGGVHKSTISRWESGDVAIPVDKLDAIERVTGVPRAALRPDIFKGYSPQPEEAA